MNDGDHERFEAELRKLAPASPPTEFMDRLVALRKADAPGNQARSESSPSFWHLLRWGAPAAAIGAAVLAMVVWRAPAPTPAPAPKAPTSASAAVLKADDVEFDQQLVASFEAIARLPSGEQVRFRFREWTDALVLRDSVSGIVIEQNSPRLEVVPVSFETY